MAITEQTAFDVFTETTHPDTPDTGMEAGTLGSGDMESWNSDDAIINNLLVGTYTNASSYDIPASVTQGTAFNIFTEKTHGATQTGVEVGHTYLGTKVGGTILLKDPDTGKTYTVAGTNVRSETADLTFTDDPSSTGSFELGLGSGGTYTVEATHPALQGASKTFELADGEAVLGEEFHLKPPSGGGLVVGPGGQG